MAIEIHHRTMHDRGHDAALPSVFDPQTVTLSEGAKVLLSAPPGRRLRNFLQGQIDDDGDAVRRLAKPFGVD